MTTPSDISLVDRLTGLERAYHGLTDTITFDEQLANTRKYVADQIAEIILSDEIATEIQGIPDRVERAVAGQTINEICCEVFGSEDWNRGWEKHRQWLGDAIIAASQA
jgi:hypothetical protein